MTTMIPMNSQTRYLWLAFCIVAVIFVSVLGFAIFNLPPARVFMGDVGSTFLGFIFAAISIWGSNQDASHMPLFMFVIILSVFIFDTAVTLVRRIIRKEHFLPLSCAMIIYGKN